MAIEGPLRELGIHDVFQLLDLSRKTGVLRVMSELRRNAGTLYFEEGAVVYAEIRSNPHPLGTMLVRSGRITEGDLKRAHDMQQRQDDPAQRQRRPHPQRLGRLPMARRDSFDAGPERLGEIACRLQRQRRPSRFKEAHRPAEDGNPQPPLSDHLRRY